jgi:CheY-like chemotaxis protein/HD-like signal output (HDOD) protein
MAHILHLDESDVAGRALAGLLARGNHGCSHAKSPPEAWRLLREGVAFDLVILEVKLGDAGGLGFLQRLRTDWFCRAIPAVVYTGETDPGLARRALLLGAQNFLHKPYDERTLQAEVAKAMASPWRQPQFEDARAFAAEAGVSGEELAARRRAVMLAFEEAARIFPTWAEKRRNREAFEQLTTLARVSADAGIRAGADLLRHLQTQAQEGNWTEFEGCGDALTFASRLIFWQLNPSFSPVDTRPAVDAADAKVAAEQARWESIGTASPEPLLRLDRLKQEIDGLTGCPVAGSAAAAFHMATEGGSASMAHVMDLAASDSGLAAQVLTAANRGRMEDREEIEDPRAAASLLGDRRLAALAKALPVFDERMIERPPLTWSGFWMYQAAVGRVAQFVCTYLEFNYLAPIAGTAGLLHEIGKLALLKLHPFALREIVRVSRTERRPLEEVERRFLGCTTRELGVHLAETQHLPSGCCSVLRWLETPALAMAHMDLVAIVSIARHVCRHAHVGDGGDLPEGGHLAVTATPAWSVLEARLFPSFDMRKFEVQAHAFALTVRNELAGRINAGRPSHAQRAAELV